MNIRNDLEVVINNRRYTLSGYESQEYLQKIASYLNQKNTELKSKENYNQLDSELRNVLMEINLADDYYKSVRQTKDLEQELEKKEQEIFDMKHELLSLQSQLEALQKKLEETTGELSEAQKDIVRLETAKGKNGNYR